MGITRGGYLLYLLWLTCIWCILAAMCIATVGGFYIVFTQGLEKSAIWFIIDGLLLALYSLPMPKQFRKYKAEG